MWRWMGLALSLLVACGSSDDSSGGSGAAGGSSGSGGSGGSGASSGGSAGSSGSSGTSGAGGSAGSSGGASLECPALGAATGTVVSVTPADAGQLPSIVSGAEAGTTIELADGTYDIGATLQLAKEGVTLRSQSDVAANVVIDGGYQVNELVAISASNVTVAHVTLTHAVHHPIHVYPPGGGSDVVGTRLYGLRITDSGQQFVKVNPVSTDAWVDEGRIECSEFVMTDAGRPKIESCCGGCYTGGIDVHAGYKWVVRNNRFEGIYCDGAGLAEHAIHFWKGSRDTLVENNVIIDCARGIGFGLAGGVGERDYPDQPNGGVKLAHYDGIIRNNVIWSSIDYYDTGIELHIAKQPLVVHNTVVSAPNLAGFFSSIDYRFPETYAVIRNNLTRKISVRDGAQGDVDHNQQDTPLDWFVDAPAGDFHLQSGASGAIDQGVVVPEAGVDMDGQTHDVGVPDLGADERAP